MVSSHFEPVSFRTTSHFLTTLVISYPHLFSFWSVHTNKVWSIRIYGFIFIFYLKLLWSLRMGCFNFASQVIGTFSHFVPR